MPKKSSPTPPPAPRRRRHASTEPPASPSRGPARRFGTLAYTALASDDPLQPTAGPAQPVNETAERILVSALEIFAQAGFDGTTTRAIAARADVNLGLLKYYFGGKEELWKAAVDRIFSLLFRTLVQEAPAAIDNADQLRAVLRTCVAFAARNANLIRLMNDEGKRDGPRLRWLVDRHARRLFEIAIALLETARARGLVRDVPSLHLYYTALGATVMLFSQAPEVLLLTGIDPTQSEEIIEAHTDALATLFLTNARAPTPARDPAQANQRGKRVARATASRVKAGSSGD